MEDDFVRGGDLPFERGFAFVYTDTEDRLIQQKWTEVPISSVFIFACSFDSSRSYSSSCLSFSRLPTSAAPHLLA